jgi:hypothetical protein
VKSTLSLTWFRFEFVSSIFCCGQSFTQERLVTVYLDKKVEMKRRHTLKEVYSLVVCKGGRMYSSKSLLKSNGYTHIL